jgi:hypothetical protein
MAGWTISDAGCWPLGTFDALRALPDVVHGVTTREGPAFGTDALSAATADAAAATAACVGLKAAAWVKQVHGGTVLRVDRPGLAGQADALVTDTPGLGVLGRSADCPLILAAGRRGDGSAAVGFAHASWRATLAGITAAMLDKLAFEMGVRRDTIHAAIAPAAGPCCYEVGTEVRDAALAALGGGAAEFFQPHGGRWRFDLWAANLAQLAAAGVPRDRVALSGVCTICRGERFWSWRRQGEAAGRFAAVIGVRPTRAPG